MFKMMNDMTEPSQKPQQTRDVAKSQLLKLAQTINTIIK